MHRDVKRLPQGSMEQVGNAAGPRLSRNRAGRLPEISVSPAAVTISQAIKVTKWSTFTGDFEP